MPATRLDALTPLERVKEWVRPRWDRTLQVRIVRAGTRYHFGRAGLFSGGVTYSALLSITAALTIVVNVTRAFLGSHPDILRGLLQAVEDVLPGLIDDGTNDGILDPSALAVDSTWHPATVVSGVIVVWTALSVMTGLRRAIRAMFGLGGAPLPLGFGKLRDLLGFLGLGLGVVLSSALAGGVGLFGGAVVAYLGVEGALTAFLLGAGALLAAAGADWLVFVMLFRVTAGVRIPRRDLFAGAALGAVGSGALRLAGTSVFGVVQDPLLASFAAVATLLLWVNLAVRLTLFTAAWTSNPPPVRIPVEPARFRHHDRPNYVTMSAPHTLRWPHHAVTGALDVDASP